MKILIQNVDSCSVVINSETFSSIKKGYCIFVSFTMGDTKDIVDKMISKLLKSRLFPDENGKTNLNINNVNGEIMSISQFTLYASLKDGNRPSFVNCLDFKEANELYLYFNQKLIENGIALKTGIFGADMKVNIVNDGPFTIMLDNKEI